MVAHVTRAGARELFLGMMLTLAVHTIVQLAAEMESTPMRKGQGYRSLSIGTLEAYSFPRAPRLSRLRRQWLA